MHVIGLGFEVRDVPDLQLSTKASSLQFDVSQQHIEMFPVLVSHFPCAPFGTHICEISVPLRMTMHLFSNAP